jgi:hypothetical protein
VKGTAVEMLASGQQVAAFGIHPDTLRPYAWPEGDLTEWALSSAAARCTASVADAKQADPGNTFRDHSPDLLARLFGLLPRYSGFGERLSGSVQHIS